MQQSLITTYGPLALSALVIIGMLAGWLLGRVDTSTTLTVVVSILASNGVVGIVLKQSLAIMQAPSAPQKSNPPE